MNAGHKMVVSLGILPRQIRLGTQVVQRDIHAIALAAAIFLAVRVSY